MPTFQQKFSLSWGCKNWLLTHKNCPWSVRSCQPAALTVLTLSLLFVLDKFTPICSILYLEILFQPLLGLPQQNLTQRPFRQGCSRSASYGTLGLDWCPYIFGCWLFYGLVETPKLCWTGAAFLQGRVLSPRPSFGHRGPHLPQASLNTCLQHPRSGR